MLSGAEIHKNSASLSGSEHAASAKVLFSEEKSLDPDEKKKKNDESTDN